MAEIPIPENVQQAASDHDFGDIHWIQMSQSRWHGHNNFLYEGGVVQTNSLPGNSSVNTFPWEAVETARHGRTVDLEYRQSTGSVSHQMRDSYEVGFRGVARAISFYVAGERDNTLAAQYFSSGLREPTRFNRDAQLANNWLDRKLSWAQAGQAILLRQKLITETVEMGPLTAEYEGLRVRGKLLPWQNLRILGPSLMLPDRDTLLRRPTQHLESNITIEGAAQQGKTVSFTFREFDLVNLRVVKDLVKRLQE